MGHLARKRFSSMKFKPEISLKPVHHLIHEVFLKLANSRFFAFSYLVRIFSSNA